MSNDKRDTVRAKKLQTVRKIHENNFFSFKNAFASEIFCSLIVPNESILVVKFRLDLTK
jgi:hypothetical protein